MAFNPWNNKFTGTIAQIIVLVILIPFVCILIGFIPGAPQIAERMIWELTDNVSLLQGWVVMIQQAASSGPTVVEAENVLSALIRSVSTSFIDTLLIGFCVSIFLQLFSVVRKVKQKTPGGFFTGYQYRVQLKLHGLPIIPIFLGVLTGVLLLNYISAMDDDALVAIFSSLLTIILMLIAIGLMLGFRHRSSAENKAYAVQELLKVLNGGFIGAGAGGAAVAVSQFILAASYRMNFWIIASWYLILLGITGIFVTIYIVIDSAITRNKAY